MEFTWLLAFLVQYGYLLVFVLVLLDNTGLPLPGEPVLLVLGFLARTGHVDLVGGIAAATAGAMLGDNASYWVGRLGGLGILRTYCHVTLGSPGCVDKALAYYRRFGRITVVLGRFVIGLRAFLVPLAGSARMPYGQFLLFDTMGTLSWSALFIGAGYLSGGHLELISRRLRGSQILLGLTLAAALLAYLSLRLWKRRRLASGLPEKSSR